MSRNHVRLCLALVALFVVILAWPTFAQPRPQQPCGPRAKVIKQLAEKYGETRMTEGSVEPGISSVMETWADEEDGSWTIILSKPDGTACILVSGWNWLGDAGPLGPQGDDA